MNNNYSARHCPPLFRFSKVLQRRRTYCHSGKRQYSKSIGLLRKGRLLYGMENFTVNHDLLLKPENAFSRMCFCAEAETVEDLLSKASGSVIKEQPSAPCHRCGWLSRDTKSCWKNNSLRRNDDAKRVEMLIRDAAQHSLHTKIFGIPKKTHDGSQRRWTDPDPWLKLYFFLLLMAQLHEVPVLAHPHQDFGISTTIHGAQNEFECLGPILTSSMTTSQLFASSDSDPRDTFQILARSNWINMQNWLHERIWFSKGWWRAKDS